MTDALTRHQMLVMSGVELRRHPYPGQRYKHGWIPVSVATAGAALGRTQTQAQAIRDLEQHIEKLRREGPPPYQRDPERYVQNELQARVHGLPIGSRIPKMRERQGFESLPSGHWRDPKTGRLYGEMGPMGWSDDILAAEEYLKRLMDPDWWRVHGEDAAAEIEKLRRQARDLKMRRQRQNQRSLTPEGEDDGVAMMDVATRERVMLFLEMRRTYDRIPEGFKGGGQFRGVKTRLVALLKDWAKGEGSDDPLGELESDPDKLRTKLRNVITDLRKERLAAGDTAGAARLVPKRGAPLDELKALLYNDVKVQARGDRDADKPSAKFTLQGKVDPAKAREIEVDNRIRAAYREFQSDTDHVMLSDLRRKLGDLPRSDVDAALTRMNRGDYDGPGGPVVVPQSNQKALTQADRDAAIHVGGQDKHAIHFDDPSPRPVPKSLRDVDVAVYKTPDGKPALYREDESGKRGALVQQFESLDEMAQWADDNGEPRVAEWARKESGGKAPPKSAAAFGPGGDPVTPGPLSPRALKILRDADAAGAAGRIAFEGGRNDPDIEELRARGLIKFNPIKGIVEITPRGRREVAKGKPAPAKGKPAPAKAVAKKAVPGAPTGFRKKQLLEMLATVDKGEYPGRGLRDVEDLGALKSAGLIEEHADSPHGWRLTDLGHAVLDDVNVPAPAKAVAKKAPANATRPRVSHLRTIEPPPESSSTLIVPTPTPASPRSWWGKVRDDPRVSWSEAHGRPGNYDQVDRVYTAPTAEDAKRFLRSMGDGRLDAMARAVEDHVDVRDLDAHRDREVLIDRIVAGIREPEGPARKSTAAAKKAAPKAPRKTAPTKAVPSPRPKPPGDRELTADELLAIRDLSAKGTFTENGWVPRADLPPARRQLLDGLAEQGYLEKHTGPGGEAMFRINRQSAGARRPTTGGALEGDVLPPVRRPEPRLSLTKVRRGAILEGYRDPNKPSAFGNLPEDGATDKSRVVRLVVQRIERVDENGEPTKALFATHRRIVGHDVDTGQRIQSGPVPAGSYWSWVANPDDDESSVETGADIEGEFVETPTRPPLSAAPDLSGLTRPHTSLTADEQSRVRRLVRSDPQIFATVHDRYGRVSTSGNLNEDDAEWLQGIYERDRAFVEHAAQDAHLKRTIDQAAKKAGQTPGEYKAATAARLKEWFAGKPIAVRVRDEAALRDVISGGRFKTQLEGARRAPGLAGDPNRRRLGEQILGVSPDAPIEERPIYGYVAVGGIEPALSPGRKIPGIREVEGQEDVLSSYGQVQVVLKPGVRSRTTATVGDSLDEIGFVRPTPVDNPTAESLGFRDLDSVMEPGWTRRGYVEAQIHGGVRAGDIAEVIFADTPDRATVAALDGRGIPWRVLRKGDASVPGTFTPSLPDAPDLSGLTIRQKRARLKALGFTPEQIDELAPTVAMQKKAQRSEDFDDDELRDDELDEDEDLEDEDDLDEEEPDDEDEDEPVVEVLSPATRARALAMATRAAGHDITPGNDELHHYWTRGKGLAKWLGHPHEWTSLYHHLLKYAPTPEAAKRWASAWFHEVKGIWPGSDLHRVEHGKPPRGNRIGPG